MYKRHVVSKDLFVSEKNKKIVSSPAVDFASRKQGWNSLWFARLAFQNNRARKNACCWNCKYNSSLTKIYNIFRITTIWVIIKKLKRMSTCCSTTEGSWKSADFNFIMCLWSEFFRIEEVNTISIKLLCYVKIILGKSFWASQKLFEIPVTDNIK